MKKIILIGIPNAGKSTLGRRAAEVLNMSFYDIDSIIIENLKLERLADFTRIILNGRFIKEQIKIMCDLFKNEKPAIISTSAETALIHECAVLMKNMGTIIHIKRDPEISLAGMREKKCSIVMEINGERVDTQKGVIEEYAKEISAYEALADLTLENNGTEDEGLERLLKMLEQTFIN
ncbi:MAG: hypothetical protein FWB86_14045 [Treponema sp.]|nr:hypothetical protein [Treponema sp.]